ncbi:MAG: hypothetical protein QHI48_06910 [Bacteroidota bacterium]|nr:hypothetical protein [Bacteroidota bacterium]
MDRTTAFLGTLILVTLSAAVDCRAQVPPGKRFGVGVSLGEPTAVTVKWRTTPTTAVDVAIGHSMMGYPRVHADYVRQFFYLFPRTGYRLNFYAGLGAGIGFGDKGKFLLFASRADSSRWFYTKTVSVAARGVAGLNYYITRSGLELFLEVNPLVGVIPKAAVDFEASLGVRLYIF